MRFGLAEGSPQEIKDLYENQGKSLADYLEAPEARLERRWLIIPASMIAIALVTIVLWGSLSLKLLLLLFLAGAAAGIWLAVSVQVRFRSPAATFVIGLGVLLLLLVAAGLIAPRETVDLLRNLRAEP